MNFVPLGVGPVNAVICCNLDRSRFSYVAIQVIFDTLTETWNC